jgi:hypothetical protein
MWGAAAANLKVGGVGSQNNGQSYSSMIAETESRSLVRNVDGIIA